MTYTDVEPFKQVAKWNTICAIFPSDYGEHAVSMPWEVVH